MSAREMDHEPFELDTVNEVMDRIHDVATPMFGDWQRRSEEARRTAVNILRNEDYQFSVEAEMDGFTVQDAQSHAASWMSPSIASEIPASAPGHFAEPKLFALDHGLTEYSFLDWFPKGDATISFYDDQGKLESIKHVNLALVSERAPVLAMAFEESRSGPQLFLKVLTSATALPFLRFLYTGTYALNGGSTNNVRAFEDVPTSVLFHAQLYRLADLLDLPHLRKRAYVNIVRQCEFGCSSPEKPIDLCEAIRYIYEHLHQHENLLDTIVNYCVSCYSKHELGKDTEFQKVAVELRPFSQALCQNVINRDFEEGDNTPLAIIQMPFAPPKPHARMPINPYDVGVPKFHGRDPCERSEAQIKRRKISDAESTPWTLPVRARDNEQLLAGSLSIYLKPSSSKTGAGIKLPSKGLGQTIRAMDDLLKAASSVTPTITGGSGFQMVQPPPDVESASDSDSDSSGFVKVEKEVAAAPVDAQTHALPIRTREPDHEQIEAQDVSGSDSEGYERINTPSESEEEWEKL